MGGRAADSAANTARDSAAEARSKYYTAEEMAEFAKPKKKKVRSGACRLPWSNLLGVPAHCSPAGTLQSYQWLALQEVHNSISVSCQKST